MEGFRWLERVNRGFWRRIEEQFLARNKVCARLCSIGLNAHMVERGRAEENVGLDWVMRKDDKSLGLIEIHESQICWVNVIETKSGKGTQGETVRYENVYIVPDSTLYTRGDDWLIESTRQKGVPLIGRVLDIKWKANCEDELIMRLGQDVLLNQTLIRLNEDVQMRSFPKYGCWAISSSKYMHDWLHWVVGRSIPSREQWDCYEMITRFLLEFSERKKL